MSRTLQKSVRDSAIETIQYPFSSDETLSFDEYVKHFTSAFTRMNDFTLYSKDDFYDGVYDKLKKQTSRNTFKVSECPMTLDYISMDSPEGSIEDILDVWSSGHNIHKKHRNVLKGISRKEWFDKIFPKFKYNINSLGFRSSIETKDLTDNEFIPVFGCSHTWGVGIPEEWIWYNNLGETKKIFNCGIVSGGVHEAYMFMKTLYREKKFNKAYIVIPHSERFVYITDKKLVEGLSTIGTNPFLKQLDIDPNLDTKNFYRNITLDAIKMFCEKHNIELFGYIKHSLVSISDFSTKFRLPGPPLHHQFQRLFSDLKTVNSMQIDKHDMPNYVARDMLHYGKKWHELVVKEFEKI